MGETTGNSVLETFLDPPYVPLLLADFNLCLLTLPNLYPKP